MEPRLRRALLHSFNDSPAFLGRKTRPLDRIRRRLAVSFVILVVLVLDECVLRTRTVLRTSSLYCANSSMHDGT